MARTMRRLVHILGWNRTIRDPIEERKRQAIRTDMGTWRWALLLAQVRKRMQASMATEMLLQQRLRQIPILMDTETP